MTTTNRIPSATLSRLMIEAWKLARRAAKASGQPVRTHLAEAMKKSWSGFRSVIEIDRRRARAEAAELATLPAIAAVITGAVSDKQRAYAETVAPRMAKHVARAFKAFRDGLEQEDQRAIVDATAARFAGATASFWLDVDTGNLPDVVHVLCCRHAGIEIDPTLFMKDRIRLADMATLS